MHEAYLYMSVCTYHIVSDRGHCRDVPRSESLKESGHKGVQIASYNEHKRTCVDGHVTASWLEHQRSAMMKAVKPCAV